MGAAVEESTELPVLQPLQDNEKSEQAKEKNEKASEKTEHVALSKSSSTDNLKDKGKPPPKPMTPYYRLYRFATAFDYLLIFIGVLAAMAHGVIQPLFAVIFGNVVNGFGPGADMVDVVSKNSIWFVVLAAVAFVSSYIQVASFMAMAHRQANRIREEYFKALLRQDMSWYDKQEQGAVTSRISSDVLLIEEALGDKVTLIIQNLTMFVAGFIVALVNSWKMALVILSFAPLLMTVGGFMGKIIASFALKGQKAYSKAGSVAEEVISNVRTVVAFSGEQNELFRYGESLVGALRTGEKKGHAAGVGIGATFLVIYSVYGLAFWYGSTLINASELQAGTVLTVFFSVIIGSMAIGQAAPNMTAIGNGRGAAYAIFNVIDRVPEIDSLSDEGEKPASVKGDITFRSVHFTYPSRPDIPILRGLNIHVRSGTTVALVGPSGSGKSTTVGLLERFYDPSEGVVQLDGKDIKTLSVRWLRSQIGIVSQEPVLFSTNIAENISYGKENATQEEIEEAAKLANAHDFIMKLPNGYRTLVGERGGQLSGGQKQRIAIARALINNPKILLLDEATSALDNRSEKVVQQALDRAARGRTTIVIAHRLSTVRNADQIIVIDKGQVIEQGDHDSLMAKPDSVYKMLVERQSLQQRKAEAGVKEALSNVKAAEDGKATEETTGDDEEGDDDEPLPEQQESASPREYVAIDVEKPAKGSRGNSAVKDETSILDQIGEEKPTSNLTDGQVLARAFRLNGPEWPYIVLGLIASITAGLVFPMYAIVMSELVTDLLFTTGDELNRKAIQWALIFVGIAVGACIANYCQNVGFTVAGERLTERLRLLAFDAMMHQEVGWFDLPQQSTGVLATKLATDATLVQGATSQRLGLVIQTFSTLGGGIIIALVACWKLALVVIACVPLAAAGGVMRVRAIVGFNLKAKKSYEQSGFFAAECIGNVRTVVGLGRMDTFMVKFAKSVEGPNKAAVRNSQISGVAFGFGEMIGLLIFALAFWYGAQTVQDLTCDFTGMFRSIIAIVFGAMVAGQINSFAPDYGKAKQAARDIFDLIDRTSKIDVRKLGKEPEIPAANFNRYHQLIKNSKLFDTKGRLKKDPARINAVPTPGITMPSFTGTIEFRDIHFNYPARPNNPVLRGLNLKIEAGRTVALVGSSGCGKSTLIQLLERFYDPSQGQVLVDGVDIKTMDLIWYRKHIGLVQQEPVLFACTIGENIRYGRPDADDLAIIRASTDANAHKFIDSLPDKYDTFVGERGAQLSGGQKQRVAIARAMIRDPKILLLDEATSALDSESEAIVQEALDRAARGRTTLLIAHRLSTVRNADEIVVIDQGVVAERGTHQELLELGGLYHNLVHTQVEH